jgi:uncharacterized ion transporter superfamily protein YfcC
MAIENLKKHLILALLIFNITFLATYIATQKKGWFIENIAYAFIIC